MLVQIRSSVHITPSPICVFPLALPEQCLTHQLQRVLCNTTAKLQVNWSKKLKEGICCFGTITESCASSVLIMSFINSYFYNNFNIHNQFQAYFKYAQYAHNWPQAHCQALWPWILPLHDSQFISNTNSNFLYGLQQLMTSFWFTRLTHSSTSFIPTEKNLMWSSWMIDWAKSLIHLFLFTFL